MKVYRHATLWLAIVCVSHVSAQSSGASSCYRYESADTLQSQQLQEVTVSGQSASGRIAITQIGAEQLELHKLAAIPALFGEHDIIKSIALMPGVRNESEGSGGFEVRGGNASQNLVLLDGITLYNPTHVMGVFSTFNDNAVNRATLYKGPVPAYYGGASSAVLDTSLAAGDMENYHASASIGLLAAKVKAEGPIVGDKLSFAVSARRSYVDLFLKMVPQYRSTVMNFYDVTAKLRYHSGAHLVDLSFIGSRDNMAITDIMGLHWGNYGGSVNWTATASDRWRFITTVAATDFSNRMEMSIANTDQAMSEYIHNFSFNERSNFAINENHSVEFGLRSELLRVKSGEFDINGNTEREIRSGWQNAVWIDYDGTPIDRLSISGGVRLSLFESLSGQIFHDYIALDGTPADFSGKTYISIEPRASIRYELSDCHSVRAGAGVSTQNTHSLRASSISFPFDRYAISSANIKPEISTQYGVGYSGMTRSGDYDWSTEIYCKSLHNVYDYRDGYSMFSHINLESLILGGKGRSYGVELMFRKNTGRLTGWVAYTLSSTRTRISGINGGKWYDASNDRRHEFSIVAIYRLNDSWDLSATWSYLSGQPLTAPDVKYQLDGTTCYFYSSRNGYHTPSTNRLDLSATYTHTGRRFTYQWSFGIYNSYCRYNPFIIYFEDDPDKPSGTRAVQMSLYGLLPSVSYTLKF